MIPPIIAMLLVTSPAVAPPKVRAIVIGTNQGLPRDVPLQFGESDAAAVFDALIETQAVNLKHAELHTGVGPDRVADALALGADDADVLLFFLSSHGGAQGAHLDGELLPWRTLDALLSKTRARVVIAFVDACQSGALLTPKGFVRSSPLVVSLAPVGPRGRVLIASSGANEIATESIRLQGSPFAHHLTTALRGAADADDDGRVTVAEAYAYIYQRTIATTADAPAGPQHPTRHTDLFGADDVVLSIPRGTAKLVRSPGVTSTCLVLDEREVRVLAEIPPGHAVRMVPAPYVLKCIREDGVDVARGFVRPGVTNVDTMIFERQALTFALAKGPRGAPKQHVGVVGSHVFGPGDSWPSLGLSWRAGDRTVEWNSMVLVAPSRGAVIATGGAYSIPWFGGSNFGLAVGIDVGARFDARAFDDSAVFFGQFARVDVAFAPLTLVGRFDLNTAFAWRTDDVFVFTILSIGVAHEF